MKNTYWHMQMHLPEGREGIKINVLQMLQESCPIIGTTEWDNFQCSNFKENNNKSMQIDDVVLVREGQTPIALCKILSDSFSDNQLEEKYKNCYFRKVEVLDFYKGSEKFPQYQKTLEKLVNHNTASWNFINSWYQKIKNNMKIEAMINVLKHKKQVILQGAPGTGKTYNTAELAVAMCNPDFTKGKNRDEIMDEYKRLCKEGQINFTTFHQSMDYEEFVEGLMPSNDSSNNGFEVKSGIFKNICTEALDKENSKKNYVLIIDEINRGNISKILGELITLLEADKRVGQTNELTATLPYSQNEFGVPSNLYIIGTMNTADRSVGCIDYAIRRRFAFMTVKSDFEAIKDCFTKDELRESAKALYDEVALIIKEHINSEFNFEDLMIGHSYFIAKTKEELQMKLDYEIKPLLMEYVNDGIINYSKDEISKLSVGSVTASQETSDSNNG